jgi:hypothetical protein
VKPTVSTPDSLKLSGKEMEVNATDPRFDDTLWCIIEDCCPGKHYLLYNPHTFPGRMGVWCPSKQIGFCVSKSEIQECSLEACYWIKGFLVGNEPDPPTDEEGDCLPEDNPRHKKWRAAIRQFPETGIWVVQDRECEDCGEQLLPTQPGLKCPTCSSSAC